MDRRRFIIVESTAQTLSTARAAAYFLIALTSALVLSSCRTTPTEPSLTVAPATALINTYAAVCYTVPSGTQAVFLGPGLDGRPGMHSVPNTASACFNVRVVKTTQFILTTMGSELKSTAPVRATVVAFVTQPIASLKPVAKSPKPLARRKSPSAEVVGVQADSFEGLCPARLMVTGAVHLAGGGTVPYQLFRSDGGSGPVRALRVGVKGRAQFSQSAPFPETATGWVQIVGTGAAAYHSDRKHFSFPCHVVADAQLRIWREASEVRCKDGSGYLGSGCARTVNRIVAEAIGRSIPPGKPVYICGGTRRRDGKPWDPQAQHECSTTWVPDVAQMLEEHSEFGRALSQSDTVPGDIAIQDGTDPQRGMNHIGFCEDFGCVHVLSNQSSTGRLCGRTNATMSDNGYPYSPLYVPTFYRVYRIASVR